MKLRELVFVGVENIKDVRNTGHGTIVFHNKVEVKVGCRIPSVDGLLRVINQMTAEDKTTEELEQYLQSMEPEKVHE